MKKLDEEKKKKAKFLMIAAAVGILSVVSFLISTKLMLWRSIIAIIGMAVLMMIAEK